MVAAGHVETVQEAFDEWIDRNGPAYVPRQGMNSRAGDRRDHRRAGGIPVLAHYPAAPEQPTLIKLLMDWGIARARGLLPRFDAPDGREMAELRGDRGLVADGRQRLPWRQVTYAEAHAARRSCHGRWPTG